MTSSKPDAPFTPNPLWARPSTAFTLKEAVAEEAPFRPLGLAACMREASPEPLIDEGTSPDDAGADLEDPVPPTEAQEAALAAARAEGYEAGYAAGEEAGHARGLAEGQEQGHEAGYSAGHAAGLAEGGAKREAALGMLTEIETALAGAALPLDDQLEAFRRLTLHLVETVLRRTLADGMDLLTPLLERTLEELDERGAAKVSVALNPKDFESLAEALGQRFGELGFVIDPVVPPGSVSLRSGASIIDDFLDQRLETLAREWLGEARGWKAERLGTPLTPAAPPLEDVADAEWTPVDGAEDEAP